MVQLRWPQEGPGFRPHPWPDPAPSCVRARVWASSVSPPIPLPLCGMSPGGPHEAHQDSHSASNHPHLNQLPCLCKKLKEMKKKENCSPLFYTHLFTLKTFQVSLTGHVHMTFYTPPAPQQRCMGVHTLLAGAVTTVVNASSWPLVCLVCSSVCLSFYLSVCPLVSLHHMIFFTSNQSQFWESQPLLLEVSVCSK